MNNILLNKIYNYDALTILSMLPDNSVDAIVTDPPYLYDKKSNYSGVAADIQTYQNIEFMSDGFDMKILDECIRVMKKINIVLFCSREQLPVYYRYFADKHCESRFMTWCKTNPVPACCGKYLSDTEYILHFYESGVESNFMTDHYLMPAKRHAKNDPLYHPTKKPTEILRDLINSTTQEGDIVFDPFMGSGSTAVACIETGRYFIGSELSAEYHSVCEQRIAMALNDNPQYALSPAPIITDTNEKVFSDSTIDTIPEKSINMAYIDITDKNDIPFGLFEKLADRLMVKPHFYIHVTQEQLPKVLLHFEAQNYKYDIISNWASNGTTFLLYLKKGGVQLYGDYNSKRKYYEDTRDMSIPNQDSISYGLMKRIIENSTLPGQTVFCTGGFGTCIEVCMRENLRFIAYEEDTEKTLSCIDRIGAVRKELLTAACNEATQELFENLDLFEENFRNKHVILSAKEEFDNSTDMSISESVAFATTALDSLMSYFSKKRIYFDLSTEDIEPETICQVRDSLHRITYQFSFQYCHEYKCDMLIEKHGDCIAVFVSGRNIEAVKSIVKNFVDSLIKHSELIKKTA